MELIASATAIHAAGDTQVAVETLLSGPNDIRFMIVAAQLFARWDVPEAALEMGRRISNLAPGDPNGAFHVAGALRRLGRLNEAEDVLHDAPTRWAANASILSIWASFPMHRGAWKEALARWDTLIERFPTMGKFVAMKARCLIIAGHMDDAALVLRKAETDFPEDDQCSIVRSEFEQVMARCAHHDGRDSVDA